MRQGGLQHVVGGVDFNSLREKADSFVKLACRKGVVALLLEFFSHEKVFVYYLHLPSDIYFKPVRSRGAATPALRRLHASSRPRVMERGGGWE